MLRLLLSPRWLVRHVLAIVLVSGMGWLGAWQFDVARDDGETTTDDPAPVALTSLASSRRDIPADAAGRQVTAEGRYDAEHQLLVADRDLRGRTGYWVLTPLRLADGTGVSVVRGWVPGPDDPRVAVPTTDPVTVTGRLQPSESPEAPRSGDPLPKGQISSVSAGEVASQVPYDLYSGFVVLTNQEPASETAPERVAATGPPAGGSDLDLQNLAYALQWWAFSGFVVFMWWRLLRDERGLVARRADSTDNPGVATDSVDAAT